ncbi:hypothetical protein LIA77_10307 [Sarocladium implicatum]|nr:hypothetical protein LIA77_10307 [Sarocladium implicatum]
MAPRIQPPDVAYFFKNGILETTAENAYFLRDTGIEPDHGTLWFVRHRAAAALFRRMGVRVSFSDRYVLHPHHIRLFAPRGDPWMGHIRSRYRKMLEIKPLWVHACSFGKQPAIVRFSCSRRLAACVYRAAATLKEKDPALEVRGTVLIFNSDVHKAVNWDSREFYEMMVLALEEEMRLLKAGL